MVREVLGKRKKKMKEVNLIYWAVNEISRLGFYNFVLTWIWCLEPKTTKDRITVGSGFLL